MHGRFSIIGGAYAWASPKVYAQSLPLCMYYTVRQHHLIYFLIGLAPDHPYNIPIHAPVHISVGFRSEISNAMFRVDSTHCRAFLDILKKRTSLC